MKTVALAFILVVSAGGGQKKPEPIPKTYPNSRTFKASCDAVWPIAVQVLTSNGWGIKTSDRFGGILTLDWTRGATTSYRYSKINPLVGQYTIEKTGTWNH